MTLSKSALSDLLDALRAGGRTAAEGGRPQGPALKDVEEILTGKAGTATKVFSTATTCLQPRHRRPERPTDRYMC
jgi:hypothetical protein